MPFQAALGGGGAAIGNIITGLLTGLGEKDAYNKAGKGLTKGGKIIAGGYEAAGEIGADAARKAMRRQENYGKKAIQALKKGASKAESDVTRYARKAENKRTRYGNRAIDFLTEYNRRAERPLQPYRQVGRGATYSLADLYGLPTRENPQGGQPLSDEALAAFENSPDYQFALQQGIKARDAGAAARGMLLSGGAQKELQEFGSGLASQNFQNYVGRLFDLSQLGYGAAADTANLRRGVGQGGADIYTGTGRDIASIYTGTGGYLGDLDQSLGTGIAAGRAAIGDARARGALGIGQARADAVLGAAGALGNAEAGAAGYQGAGQVGFLNAFGGGIGDAFNQLATYNNLNRSGPYSGTGALY